MGGARRLTHSKVRGAPLPRAELLLVDWRRLLLRRRPLRRRRRRVLLRPLALLQRETPLRAPLGAE